MPKRGTHRANHAGLSATTDDDWPTSHLTTSRIGLFLVDFDLTRQNGIQDLRMAWKLSLIHI
ncbi:MAG: hypothetical protein N2039_10410, partial [Gemmataceae bacterium]|nr:hypothetical protein [Gemmataceae bacterium]